MEMHAVMDAFKSGRRGQTPALPVEVLQILGENLSFLKMLIWLDRLIHSESVARMLKMVVEL